MYWKLLLHFQLFSNNKLIENLWTLKMQSQKITVISKTLWVPLFGIMFLRPIIILTFLLFFLCVCAVAPALFTTAYNLVKRFLSDDTKSKINVLGRKYYINLKL